MPIYEYQCQSCHKVFEFIQKMSDDPMTECEECKGELQRMISQSAFHLKGGGWYKDLYSSTKKDSVNTEAGPKPAAESSAPASTAPASTATDSSSGTTAKKSSSKSSD